MNRLTKTGIFVAATAGVIVSGTLISNASWIAPTSAATVRVRAGSMPKGVTPSAAIQSGKAVVSWSAQEIVPSVKMTAYVVTAHDTEATPLPDVAHTVTASGAATESATFTAAELAGGKWKWAIIPKFQTWTGAEGKLSNPKLVFPAAAPATVLAAAATGTNAPTPPTPAPVVPAPATAETTAPAPETKPAAPKPDPTTSAPDRSAEPAKTETPKVDPTPSGSASDPHPSLTTGVS